MRLVFGLLILVLLLGACAPAATPTPAPAPVPSTWIGETGRGKVVGTVVELKSWTTDSIVVNSIRMTVLSSKVKEITKGEQLLQVNGADAGGLHVGETATFMCIVLNGGSESQSVVCSLAMPFKD